MVKMRAILVCVLAVMIFLLLPPPLDAQVRSIGCRAVPSHNELELALQPVAPAAAPADNGGLNFNMWATVVNRDGEVCAVAFTGSDRDDQWPGSRAISAQKASTANAFSLSGLALSTANLFSAVQPGGSLFGLQESNPVNTSVAYGGDSEIYGRENDPMVGSKIGGVNVFGGGLALYTSSGTLIGAIGVSGDTSCTDHVIAWKLRDQLGLDYVPAGVADRETTDNIIFDIGAAGGNPESASGFGHPRCGINDPDAAMLLEACPISDGTTDGCAASDVAP